MKNEQLIKYIANFLGLQLDKITFYKIVQKTSNFDLFDFVDFVENNLNNVALNFKKPLEKLAMHCKLYEQELRMQKEQEIQTDVQKLNDKFKKIKVLLENELKQGRKPMLDEIKNSHTKQNYFTNFEISILDRIGDVKYLITLANSHQLEDKISNSLLISLMPAQNTALPFAANAIKRF